MLMLEGKLFRFKYAPTHTLSAFVLQGHTFYVLERPWLNNKRNASCIPVGSYTAHFLPKSGSGKYRNVYHILPVADRSGILIHQGNLVSHSLGCLIIGNKLGTLGGQPAVLRSRQALRKLNRITNNSSFKLEIL